MKKRNEDKTYKVILDHTNNFIENWGYSNAVRVSETSSIEQLCDLEVEAGWEEKDPRGYLFI